MGNKFRKVRRGQVAVLDSFKLKILGSMMSGQIIATSHDLTPNGGLVREIPIFQENPGWWNIIIWPDDVLTNTDLGTWCEL